MIYLVLRHFKAGGKFYNRGDIVQDGQLRYPRTYQSDDKIVPAVSSLTIPAAFDTQGIAAAGIQKDIDKRRNLFLIAST